MKLTIRRTLDIFNSLKQLNGRESVVTSPGQPSRVVIESYKFPAATTWAIAKIMNLLKRHLEDYELARATLRDSHGGEEGMKDPVKVKAFLKDQSALLDQEIEVSPDRIKLSSLNLDINSIQPGSLAVISDLIDES